MNCCGGDEGSTGTWLFLEVSVYPLLYICIRKLTAPLIHHGPISLSLAVTGGAERLLGQDGVELFVKKIIEERNNKAGQNGIDVLRAVFVKI